MRRKDSEGYRAEGREAPPTDEGNRGSAVWDLFKVLPLVREGVGVWTQVGPHRQFIMWGSLSCSPVGSFWEEGRPPWTWPE